jgi:hypothetical protein
MAKYFGAGIPLSAGFDLSSSKPLDSRLVVADITERDNMPAVQRYQGMIVFVESTLTTYQLINDEWVTFGTNSDAVIDNLHAVATSGDYNDLNNLPDTKIVASETEPTEDHVQIWIDISEPTTEIE